MAEAAIEALAPRGGLVVGLEAGRLGPLEMMAAAHPIPSADAEEHARAVVELCAGLGAGDVLLCLLSGGGSAMLEQPVAGVGLEALRRTTERLLAAGAPIAELNAVRRALSRLKGGRLAEVVAPARIVNLIVSDVSGAPPSLVASGPTTRPVAGPDPREVVERLGVARELPPEVLRALDRPRPPPAAAAFEGERCVVVADNRTARRGLAAFGRQMGLRIAHRPGHAAGEARVVGEAFARASAARCARQGLDGVVWGGETTVRVRGSGRGGRNQELVLGAHARIGDGLLLSLGTDGVDGTSGAAGAFLDADGLRRAAAAGRSPAPHLDDNDADAFFGASGGRIVTGPTGTNVADVCVFFARAYNLGSP